MVVGSGLILVRHVYLSGEYYARIISSSSWWIGINYVLYLVHFELVTKIPKNHNLFFTTIETKLESLNFGAQASLHASFGNVCPYLSPLSLTKACTVLRLEWTSKDYYVRPSISPSILHNIYPWCTYRSPEHMLTVISYFVARTRPLAAWPCARLSLPASPTLATPSSDRPLGGGSSAQVTFANMCKMSLRNVFKHALHKRGSLFSYSDNLKFFQIIYKLLIFFVRFFGAK